MALGRLSIKVGRAGKAYPHYEYIARRGSYKKRLELGETIEGVKSANMPAWARHEAGIFWGSSDLYERKKGSTYREQELALPREMTPGQRIALVEEWVAQELGDAYPYTWAIHNKLGSDGLPQPHLHCMFSERRNDEIERGPDRFFRRYNAKQPELGGARKLYGEEGIAADLSISDRRAARAKAVKAQRKRWEELCNQHLRRAGHLVQIDMRSNADRGLPQPEPKLSPGMWNKYGPNLNNCDAKRTPPEMEEFASRPVAAEELVKLESLAGLPESGHGAESSEGAAACIEASDVISGLLEQGVDEIIEEFKESTVLYVDPELGSAKDLPELSDEPAHEHGKYAELDVSVGADEAACWEADLIEGREEAYHYVEPEPEPEPEPEAEPEPEPEPDYGLEFDPNGPQMF